MKKRLKREYIIKIFVSLLIACILFQSSAVSAQTTNMNVFNHEILNELEETKSSKLLNEAIEINTIDAGSTITISNTSLTTTNQGTQPHDGVVKLTGDGTTTVATKITIASDFNGTIILKDIRINSTNDNCIQLQSGAIVEMILSGNKNSLINTAVSGKTTTKAALNVKSGAQLTMLSESNNETDSLVVKNEINNTNSAHTFIEGAAIGSDSGENAGSINIHGGTVSAIQSAVANSADYNTVITGAAIGSGKLGTAFEISIIDANVDAQSVVSGSSKYAGLNAAVIGSGAYSYSSVPAASNTSVTITNSSVSAKGTIPATHTGSSPSVAGGAAIGSGIYGQVDGITITGSDVTAYVQGHYQNGSGIGSGQYGRTYDIYIEDSTIDAKCEGVSYSSGSAIGGGSGYGSSATNDNYKCFVIGITIKNSDVIANNTATGTSGTPQVEAAAIGSGSYGYVENILLEGSTIDASCIADSSVGYANGAAIGGGSIGSYPGIKLGYAKNLVINSGYINAECRAKVVNSAAIGKGHNENSDKVGNITINGGTIIATCDGGTSNHGYAIDPGNNKNPNLQINGGSVFDSSRLLLTQYEDLFSEYVYNKDGQKVYPVEITIGSPAVSDGLAVSAINIDGVDGVIGIPTDTGEYGISDVVTRNGGKVRLFLPATTEDETVKIKVGDTDYKWDYTRTASDEDQLNNVFTVKQYAAVNFVTGTDTVISPQEIYYGDLVSEPTEKITKPDHTFQGWYKESTYKTKWNFSSDKIYGPVTLYGNLEENPTDISIVDDFKDDDGIIVIYRTGATGEVSASYPLGYPSTYNLQLQLGDKDISDEQLEEVTWEVESAGGFSNTATYLSIEDGSDEVVAKKSGIVKLTATYKSSSASIYVVIPGDVNRDGLLAAQDATIIQRYYASGSMDDFTINDEFTLLLADMNGDGFISGQDATIIQRMRASVISPSN